MSTPPFLAACRGEPHERVPVWFMRQAGRSLPEYRAIRGEGSILDAIRQPDLATEITLQPVRRYGVDAAILYSDIVVPVAAIGFGVDVAPGTGPVVDAAVRVDGRTSKRLRRLDAEADTPYVVETVRNAGEGAARRRAAHRVRRGAVHGGQLPDRGPAVADLRADEGADAGRARRCSGRCSTRWRTWRPIRSSRRCGAGARRVPVVRLVGRRADAGAVRAPRPAALPHGLRSPRRARRARHPLRRQHRRAARADGLGGRRRRGRRLADPAVGGAQRVGEGWALQGNLDPAVCLGPWPAVAAEVRAVLDENGGHPGHVFNLGHGVLPETDPSVLEQVVALVHGEDVG